MEKQPVIKVFTRSFDLRLYRLSEAQYRDLGWETVRLTDRSADGYFYAMLREGGCDVAVNIDEDAFLVDPGALRDLVQTVLDGGYANAGCPDGGTGALPRSGDPAVTNPFFNILDLRQIRPLFNKSELQRRPGDLEPYYPFFHWLAANFKTLYLPAVKHPDGITTVLQTPDGRALCMHSWFARFYSMPEWMVRRIDRGLREDYRRSRREPGRGAGTADSQRRRIDALIDEAYALRGLPRPVFSARKRLGFLLDRTLRWLIKIPQRISRWPSKLLRRLS